MFFGLLNAFVQFKIGGSSQIYFLETGILAYPVLTIITV